MIVEPDDPDALADGIEALWRDPRAGRGPGPGWRRGRARTLRRRSDGGRCGSGLRERGEEGGLLTMLVAADVTKSYPTPRGELSILNWHHAERRARRGAVAVMGPSGSGKSTLLYILGALEPPTSGRVALDGVNPFGLPERAQAAFRNQRIGFVFQDHSLLPQCSVLENVLAPTLVAPAKAGAAEADEARARELFDTRRSRRSPRPPSSGVVGRREAARGTRPGADP